MVSKDDLGLFSDGVSATGRFGDGGRRCFIRKKCVFEILQWSDRKGCMLDKRFCCHPEGRCGFSSTGSLEELCATVTMRGRNMACDVSFCWHEAFASLHKS